ncbi:hypothetical protein QYF61_016703 [Mycteria americana]|uniref:Reverse transcriptase domain-containing protein n=1 Tax=Mycteria americana TaxID=33587 RepID=A0AAN7N2C8_MYCAM|nr:hypothetical protein QYF61_016703 [Mycteria americana]
MEKAEILNAFFALVLNNKSVLQESQRPREKFCATRPSGLTAIPERVMEQLIVETISRQLTNKKNTRSCQCGFTKEESCLTNLVTFYSEMTGLVDEGRAMDIAYLDFHMAFDTAHSNTLTERKYGLDEQTVRSIENRLNG